jgi:hypothetical protein
VVENLDDRRWGRREREPRERRESSGTASKVATIIMGIGTTFGAAIFLGYMAPKELNVFGYLFLALVALLFGWMMGNSAGQSSSEREIDRITRKCDEYLGALRMAAAKFEKTKETAPTAIPEAQKVQAPKEAPVEAPRLYTRDSRGKYRRYEP